MATGWQGELTRLVPLDKSKHMENAIAWLNDPEVTEWIVQGDFPLTRLAEEEFFDTVAKEGDTAAHFAIESTEGVHLGFSGIIHIDWRHGYAVTGSFIGRTDFWGKGYGSDAVLVRTRYAFEVLGLRLLLSEVFDGNRRSVGMLEKAGYRETGRIPQRYWKRGAYRDLLQFTVTREDWEASRAASEPEDAPAAPGKEEEDSE
jgi:RimJ/RimL family protein N-acetyltransferase